MGNRKASDKLPIPKWFRLQNYYGLRMITEPAAWLDQLAFRIDFLSLWKNISPFTHLQARTMLVDELYFDEMMSGLQNQPIVDVSQIVEQYSRQGAVFPTFKSVRSTYESVRHMTAADLYIAEQALHTTTRRVARSFFYAANEPITLENEPLYFTLGEDQEDCYAPLPSDTPIRSLHTSNWADTHRRLREQNAHYRSFDRDEDPEVQNFIRSLEKWCVQGSLEAPHLFAVDPNAPPQLAAAALRSQLEELQGARTNVKEVKPKLFAKWIDDGVLPYIDLKIAERVKADRKQNRRLAYREEDLADAIYAKNPHRCSTCVADTTKPVADALMNATSSLFRTLLDATKQPGCS